MMIMLSIIIVNYKTYELTKQTIDSIIEKNVEFDYEIRLIDNASNDGSIEKLENDFKSQLESEKIHIIKNRQNLGFAKANNKGIKISKGKYILLLNSDTEIIGDCLSSAVRKMEEEPDIGALGVKVVLPDGTLDHACKRGFPSPLSSFYYFSGISRFFPESKIFSAYKAGHIGEDEEADIDALTGAFMLMRSEAVKRAGLLDEAYFMYGEDIDLCYKIKKLGYRVVYYPKVSIIHYKGGSSLSKNIDAEEKNIRQTGQNASFNKKKSFIKKSSIKGTKVKKNPKTIYEFYRAMEIFYDRHYKDKYPAYVGKLIKTAIYIKYKAENAKNDRIR